MYGFMPMRAIEVNEMAFRKKSTPEKVFKPFYEDWNVA
jgi:hypothetical protein